MNFLELIPLNRRQAITWTNDDPFQWSIYSAPGVCVCVCVCGDGVGVGGWAFCVDYDTFMHKSIGGNQNNE